MNIQLVPRVCEQLVDQSLCEKAVNICGADTSPDLCTLKIIGSAVVDPQPLLVPQTLIKLYGFKKLVTHKLMQGSHDYLHTFVKDLAQNVSGDGHVGTVGNFIINVLSP